VEISDQGAEEPGSGVSEAVLLRDSEVQLAVWTSDWVTANCFSGCAGGEAYVLGQHSGEMRVH
jgi:hypothetical protein